MDTRKQEALNKIETLFDTETLSVLSTHNNGQPYASLVAFAVTPDLKQILFLTPSTTRKYDNLTTNPRVAMLINNSRNKTEDIYNAMAVTATGTAMTAQDHEKKPLLSIYLKRHPHLKEFAMSPTTALVCVTVDTYTLVSRFQDVIEIRMKE
ncbi:MAG: pyridoxamine 5'-phosphate oxidase family protein [Desulfobacterium sp.]|nr:pyridoxamine 5'-phosphate oxidase family protein [Desulfobacterium sp.]